MQRIAVLGNSGSGKSTLAKQLATPDGLPVLDLDTIYWQADAPGVPNSPDYRAQLLHDFLDANAQWIIEGCYEDLVALALAYHPTLILLDPGMQQCIANCKSRPWEPHKYSTEAAQDKNLVALIDWVSDYYTRSGHMSYQAHLELYAQYTGEKSHVEYASDQTGPT